MLKRGADFLNSFNSVIGHGVKVHVLATLLMLSRSGSGQCLDRRPLGNLMYTIMSSRKDAQPELFHVIGLCGCL